MMPNRTEISNFITEQLKKHQLFRRAMMIYMCWLVAYTTIDSFEFANRSIDASGIEIAAIIAAIQIPVSAMMAFMSKLYWSGK